MRILFLTHYYPPEVNAPASRTSEHCRAWVGAGHEVVVVTCAPNHPSGKLYPGYKNRLFRREKQDGVEIVRVWTFLAANEGFAKRILNYVSFMFSAWLAVFRLPRPDIVVSTSPQFFCGLAGLFVKWSRRVPWVLEVRDLWPESIISVGAMKKNLAIRALEKIEAFAYRNADRIVSVTESFVPHIAARGGSADRIDIIKNGVDLGLFQRGADAEAVKRRFGFGGRIVAAYVGTHGMAHGLDTALEAADLLRNDERIGLLLVGDGAERARLVAKSEAMGLQNIRIVGQLPKIDMPGIWAATDVSMVLLRKSDTFTKVLPSKIFEAMAMGCPIVLGVEGEAKALLSDAEAGIAISPESAQELAASILQLANDRTMAARLGNNGSAFVRQRYDRAKLAAQYLDVLISTVKIWRANPRRRSRARSVEIVR